MDGVGAADGNGAGAGAGAGAAHSHEALRQEGRSRPWSVPNELWQRLAGAIKANGSCCSAQTYIFVQTPGLQITWLRAGTAALQVRSRARCPCRPLPPPPHSGSCACPGCGV